MSNLIRRFREDLQLAGYAKRSIQFYASAVLRLQRFYNKPFYDITEGQLRQYWLCCQRDRIPCVIFQDMYSGLPSPITASKALKMVSLNFFTKTVKRKNEKSWHWMPWSSSDGVIVRHGWFCRSRDRLPYFLICIFRSQD